MAKGNGDSTIVTQSMLQEAVDGILGGMQSLHNEQAKNIEGLRKELKQEIQTVSEQVENLDEKADANYKSSNGKIKAIKATSVSREEFEELKDEVHRLKKSFASG